MFCTGLESGSTMGPPEGPIHPYKARPGPGRSEPGRGASLHTGVQVAPALLPSDIGPPWPLGRGCPLPPGSPPGASSSPHSPTDSESVEVITVTPHPVLQTLSHLGFSGKRPAGVSHPTWLSGRARNGSQVLTSSAQRSREIWLQGAVGSLFWRRMDHAVCGVSPRSPRL